MLNEIKKQKIEYKLRHNFHVNFARIRNKTIIEHEKIIKHFKSKAAKFKKIINSLKKAKTTKKQNFKNLIDSKNDIRHYC